MSILTVIESAGAAQAASSTGILGILGRVMVYSLVALVMAVFGFVGFAFFQGLIRGINEEANLSTKQKVYEQQITTKPDDTRAAWDLARVTLEKYFSRNLRQVAQIFYTSVGVMLVGFGLIVFGAVLAIRQGAATPAAAQQASDLSSKLSVISGIITEFIGATFMLIYRSTLRQANGYMAIVERINAVGMAVQIVDTIRRDDPLYTATRANMAQMLLEQFKHSPGADGR